MLVWEPLPFKSRAVPCHEFSAGALPGRVYVVVYSPIAPGNAPCIRMAAPKVHIIIFRMNIIIHLLRESHIFVSRSRKSPDIPEKNR